MNKKYFNVPVYLRDNNARIIDGVVQGDTADLFNIKLFDGTEAFDFTGYSLIVLSVVRPDGTEYIDKDGEHLDILDAKEGRMALTLPASLTSQVGMHFCTVTIYSNGVKMTTGRFNYYIQKGLSDGNGMMDSDEYPIMQKLIAQLSLIEDAERMRMASEELRVLAENGRVNDTAGIIQQASTLASQAEGYAKAAKDWYDLLIKYAGDATGVELSGIATKQELVDGLSNIDAGTFDGSVYKCIQILRGVMENLPMLKDGELGYAKEKKQLYIGSDGENVLLNGACFIAQATEPEDTGKLWIDTGNGNAIKFYDGETWASTSTATFG